MREYLFAVLLLACVVSIVIGVAHWSPGAAWIVAGMLGAPYGWLILGGSHDRDVTSVSGADGDE